MHDPRLSALFDRYRRQSDLSALAKLFDEISPEMMRVARHVAGRGVDPEDVVQSTFLASIERADAFDANRPIVPWLMGILINQARLMNRRRATRHEEAAADDLSSDAPVPDDAEAIEVRDAVARALADLPPTYREVLVAHLAEGKPPHEIARELGRPQGTVRAQLHRGLRLVRRSLPAGFSFGIAAMIDRSALAGARREVLEAAARAHSLPASAVPAATSTSKVGLSVAAAAVVLAAIVGIAWLSGRSAHADQEVALADAVAGRLATSNVQRPDRDARAAIRPGVAAVSAPSTAVRATDAVFGSVRVTVRDAREMPIQGARLDLLAWGDPLWHERVRGLVTGPDGTAEFTRVHVGFCGVHLDGGGVQTRAEVLPGAVTEIAIQLQRGLELSGVVVDERARPISGAIVEAGEQPGAEPRRVSEPTGPDGRYVLTDVARTLAVWAREETRASSEAVWLGTPNWTTKRDADLHFVLPDPAAMLEFLVVDPHGGRIAGAVAVGLEAERQPDFEASFRFDGALALAECATRATSDTNGRVRLAVDHESIERVAVSAPGFAPREVEVEDVGTLIVLGSGGRLAGVARFDDGVAAEESSIEAYFDGQREPLRARSGPDGSWEIRDAPPGRFTLRARASLVVVATEMQGVLHAGETVLWNPVLEHASVIRGVARSVDGRPAKTWLVKAVAEDASEGPLLGAWMRSPWNPARLQDLRQCYTDPDGQFAVPCAPGATYRLELRPRKRWDGPVQGALDGVVAGASAVDLRVQLERGIVRARLVDAAGRPGAGSLSVVTRKSGAGHRAHSKPDGSVECEVHPGIYTIVVWPEGGAPRSLCTREVGADQVVELGEVRIDATGTLMLRGAARAQVALRGSEGLLYQASRSGADRVATGLPAGEYVVTRRRADGSAIETHVRIESGVANVIDLD